MVSRIIGLVEKLPLLLMRGRKVEIKMDIQKVTGYLECLRGVGLGMTVVDLVTFRQALVRTYR